MQDSDELLTYEQAAERLGITKSALTNAISRGRFHPVKFPNNTRKYLRASEVAAYRIPLDVTQLRDESTADGPGSAYTDVPPAFREILANIRQAARDNFSDTTAALVSAGMQMAGIAGDSDPKAIARFLADMRQKLETRMHEFMEAAEPILSRARGAITPDDLNDLENLAMAFLRTSADDMGVDAALRRKGEQFMYEALDMARDMVVPDSIPALPRPAE